MIYRAVVTTPITIPATVEDVSFDESLLVSLHCTRCQRSLRTVRVLPNHGSSICIPTKHEFPATCISMEVSGKLKKSWFSSQSVVTAKYQIEYDFEPFVDKKYPDRVLHSLPSWGRCTFHIRCKCGEVSTRETQNNIVRPWQDSCRCGLPLYYEVQEIPIFEAVRNET